MQKSKQVLFERLTTLSLQATCLKRQATIQSPGENFTLDHETKNTNLRFNGLTCHSENDLRGYRSASGGGECMT